MWARVPHGEDEIAEQTVDASLAPLLVGGKQQRAVGHGGERAGRDGELSGKLLAVVEPRVGGEREPGVGERLRLA
jgi:hypothetical protein